MTRIGKFESPAALEEDAESDLCDDIIDKKKSNAVEGGDKIDSRALHRTGDEMARIYQNRFSSNRIIFRRRMITREEPLPKCGKVKW